MTRLACLIATAVTGIVPSASAEVYPAQPVRIIIQAAAGNGPDVLARIVADRLTKLWGQQALVINRPGAGGIIAGTAASVAKPDGYTLYMPSSSTFVVLPATHPKLPFNWRVISRRSDSLVSSRWSSQPRQRSESAP